MPARPECPENAPSSPAAAAMARRRLERERPVRPYTFAAGSASMGAGERRGRRGGEDAATIQVRRGSLYVLARRLMGAHGLTEDVRKKR